jgi:hypothetical protein
MAAVSGLVASYFSLPLYLYLVFPRPFRQVFAGNWAVLELPRERFVWDGWWIAGIFFMVVLACICCGILVRNVWARYKLLESIKQ